MERTIDDLNEIILVHRESQVEYHILEYCWIEGKNNVSVEQYCGFYMNKIDLSEMCFQEFIRANEECISKYTTEFTDKEMLESYAGIPIVNETEFEQLVLETRCPKVVAVRMDWR